MCENYFIECEDNGEVIGIITSDERENEKNNIVVYIKYTNSYEMINSNNDIVTSIEITEDDICINNITDCWFVPDRIGTIENVVINILTEIDDSELCSKEEFMRAYNSVMREITDIVGY